MSSIGTPRISAEIWAIDEAWPPPMSCTPRAHDHGAVELEADVGPRGVVQVDQAPVALHARGDASADHLVRRARLRRLAQGLPGALGRLVREDRGLERVARAELVAGVQVVPHAELQRREAELLGQLVHLALVGEAHLRRAEAAVGARERVVGERRHARRP